MTKRGIEERVLDGKYLAVIDKISPIAVFRSDKGGNWTYTNLRWQRISGYAVRSALDMGWLDTIHPDDREDGRNWWLAAVNFEENPTKELRLLTREKKVKWVTLRLEPEYDKRNILTGFIGSVTDITEQKRIKQSLQEAEALNQALVENSPNAIVIQRPDTTIVFANKKAADIVGAKDTRDLIGKSTREFAFREDLPALRKRLKDLMDGKKVASSYEFGIKRLDGKKLIGQSVATLFRWKSAEAILLVVHDITIIKENLQKLKASEKNLKQFIRDAPVAVAMLDHNMDYIGCSLKWIAAWWKKPQNVTPEYFIGKNHYKLFPDVTEYWKKVHKRALMGAVEINEEDVFTREDGNTEWLRWEVKPWYVSEETVGGIIIFTEFITERKRAENELKVLADQLMASNKELQQFAYITSHNLRAPIVNLDTLLGFYEPEKANSEDQKEIFQKIVSSVDQLKSSLNDLIKLVDIRNSQKVSRKKVRFENVLNKVLGGLHTQLMAEEAHIKHDFSKARTVYFEPNVLESIFQNLLTNALKYRRPEPLKVSLKTQDFKDYVVLTVKDNGIGMDMEKVGSKLFGMYQRFHDKGEGQGLGLYIIKSQIESLEGHIEVKSIPDKGSTFMIYFKK